MRGLTGGQYSLYRALFGLYLAVHFLQLIPFGPEVFSTAGVFPSSESSPLARLFPNVLAWLDSPLAVQILLGTATALSIAFAAGYRDRIAALLLWYVWACLFGRNPLIANPGLPYVGLLLIVHALLPSAPYGSRASLGRPDPGGGWRMDLGLLRVVWILLALGYTYSGIFKLSSPSWIDGSATLELLNNPLARIGWPRNILLAMPEWTLQVATWGALAAEVLFAPLALFRKTRPFAWASLLSMHIGLLFIVDFADLSVGMLMVHLFTFDPGWIRAKRYLNPGASDGVETIYYDGECGMCHGAVRFVMAEDDDAFFAFAPLQGETLQAALTERERAAMADSLFVQTQTGEWLSKSSAIWHIVSKLGGAWRALGWALSIVPRPIRDAGYDGIARVRKRIIAKPEGMCPVVPPPLGRRFRP